MEEMELHVNVLVQCTALVVLAVVMAVVMVAMHNIYIQQVM